MHLEVQNCPTCGRCARAPAARDGLCCRRHPARSRRARRGVRRSAASPLQADPRRRNCPPRCAVHHGARRALLANHGALTVAHEVFAAYYKMETIEHFAKISLVARMLGARACCRAKKCTAAGALGDYGESAGCQASCSVEGPPAGLRVQFLRARRMAGRRCGEMLIRPGARADGARRYHTASLRPSSRTPSEGRYLGGQHG